MRDVFFVASAEADVDEIFAALESRQPDAGKRWFEGLHHRLEQLAVFPESAPRWRGSFRRLLFRRKYGVIYQVLPQRVAIIAVYSLNQSPETIWRRLRRFLE